MFDYNLNAPSCSEHRKNHFHEIYLSDKSDIETSQINRTGLI